MNNKSMTPAGYYASFISTMELREKGERLVREVESGNWKQQQLLIDVICLFDKEASNVFVREGVIALGLGAKAEGFVNGILDTTSSTTRKICNQIIPKLNKEQMELAAAHVRSMSLCIKAPNGELEPRIAFPVPDEVEFARVKIANEVRSGNWQHQHKDTAKLLNQFGDVLLEEVYLKSIRLMGLGFFADKIIQGGAGLARMLKGKLVDFAVSPLQEAQFNTAVDYMERVSLHLPEPMPHHFFFFPNE